MNGTALRQRGESRNAALIGTASQIADVMEEWFVTGACDGFVLGASINPYTLRLIRDELVPELQRRGLFRTEYEGTTLRENLGLRAVTSRYSRDRRAAE